MLTEREVDSAIEESLREPMNATKRSALADLLIIRDYYFAKTSSYSGNSPNLSTDTRPTADIVAATSKRSEFLQAVSGRDSVKAWDLVDDLVETVRVLHPNMHAAFIDRLLDL